MPASFHQCACVRHRAIEKASKVTQTSMIILSRSVTEHIIIILLIRGSCIPVMMYLIIRPDRTAEAFSFPLLGNCWNLQCILRKKGVPGTLSDRLY